MSFDPKKNVAEMDAPSRPPARVVPTNMPRPQMVTPSPGDRDEQELDLGELIGTLVDNRWLIAMVAGAITVGGALYAIAATPVYRANALVQVEEKKEALGSLKELSSMFTGETPAETEIEIIRSRSVVSGVVDQLGLDVAVTPRYFPVFGGFVARRHKHATVASAPLGFGSYAWGGEKIQITRLKVPANYEDHQTLVLVAAEAGAYRLLDPDGALLVEGKVGEAASSPATGTEMFVREIVARPGTEFLVQKTMREEAVTEFQRDLEVRERGKQTGIIEISLEGPDRSQVIAALDAVAGAYVRQNVERTSEEARKTLEFISQQLPAVKAALEETELKLNEYKSKTGKIDLRLETQAMIDKSIDIEKQLTVLQLQKSDLKQRFTEQHPVFVALNRQIAQLEAQKSEIEIEVKKLPEAELQSVRLTRDVEVSKELYLLLLNKAQEMNVVKSGTIGNVRIIDRAALVQQQPVKPKKALIAVLALIGGLATGIAIAFARKSLQRGVDDPDDLENRVGLPVYASLPHSSKQAAIIRDCRRRKLKLEPLAVLAPKDLTVEALRSLRTSLQFALADSKNNVVLIGGPRPAVGKSFVSVNLVLLLADSGKRVLVIDADLRKGHLHTYFDMERLPGLSELLSGAIDFESAVRKTPYSNVSFVSTGTLPPNPSELLMNPRFEAFLAKASAAFDLVLIDVPPVLAVTDAVIIGRHAGVNLIVLRAGIHPLREVSLAISRMQQNGVRATGFIFNDVTSRAGPYGYAYGKYGYHYQYEYK